MVTWSNSYKLIACNEFDYHRNYWSDYAKLSGNVSIWLYKIVQRIYCTLTILFNPLGYLALPILKLVLLSHYCELLLVTVPY